MKRSDFLAIIPSLSCAHCKVSFIHNRKRKYCSLECCQSANKKDNSIKTRICEYKPCSKEFTGSANKRFCSSTCRTYKSHGDNTIPGWRERQRINNAPKSAIYVRTCPIKNILFVARSAHVMYHPTCTPMDYYYYRFVPVAKAELICSDCSVAFKSKNKNRERRVLCRVCSDREGRRINKAMRRALERGNDADSFSPYEVFKRDKWHCKHCGQHTPWKLRGLSQSNSPELDHIIPICKGGAHSLINVQLLCRSCNNKKGDKIIETYKSFVPGVGCTIPQSSSTI